MKNFNRQESKLVISKVWGREWNGEWLLISMVSFGGNKNVLRLDGGDSCIASQYTFKNTDLYTLKTAFYDPWYFKWFGSFKIMN